MATAPADTKAPNQPTPPAEVGQTPPAPKKPTKAGQEALTEFTSRWLGINKKAKSADSPPPVNAPDPTTMEAVDKAISEGIQGSPPPGKEPAETPAAEPKKPDPKPKRKPAPQAPPSYERLVEAAAEGATRVLSDAAAKTKAEPDPAKAAGETDLPEDEKRKLVVFRKMEELQPERYKGLAEKHAESIRKGLEYAEKWEQEHPGETFNEEDDEHDDFFSKNEVEFDDQHFTDALVEIKVAERLPTIERKLNQRVEDLDRRDKARTAAPIIDRHQAMTAKHFFTQLGAETEAVIRDDGTVDNEALTKLAESDPVTHQIAIHQASTVVEPLAAEIYKLCEGLEAFDEKREDHKFISNFATQAERRMLQQPVEEQLNENGQRFIASAAYAKLNATERAKYWTFGAIDLSALLAADAAKWAREQIKTENSKLEKWSKARGLKAAPTTELEPTEDDEPEPVRPVRKPSSPTVTGSPKLAPGEGAGPEPEGGPKAAFLKKFLG
jgi:hypothetical protein